MISWRMVSALSALMLIDGCTNLTAVNTTAGQLVAAASSWDSVADEFEASCARRNQVSDVPSDCSNEKKAAQGLESSDKILSTFFTALEQSSNGSNFSVDPGISSLSSSLQAIPGINANQVDAVSGVASFLADMSTKGMEERTLNKLITDGAPKAEAAIDVMSEFVVPQLTKILNREKQQTLTTFNSYIQQSGVSIDLKKMDCNAGLSTSNFATGTAFLLGQAYCAKIITVMMKLSALDNYKKSLATAKSSLKNLENGKDKLGAKTIVQQLISETSSLKGDIDKINKAF
jgi:hypothetical protein